MRRSVAIMAIGACWLAIGQCGLAQTPAELAETGQFAVRFQNVDGGFGPRVGAPSTLQATSTAVRVFGYAAGSIPDVAGAIKYVDSCFDAESGGFAPVPGGKPTVDLTATGLMAVAGLKMDPKPYLDKAVAYLNREARTFEEVRIAAAGLDAIKGTTSEVPKWVEVINANRNDDGTYGEGAGRARATGSAVAALLRLGQPIDPDKKPAILAALRAGQRDDGGWGEADKPSDMGSTYRVMRAFFMMKEKPDLAKLRSFVARHRRENGGYESNGGEPDLAGTYLGAILSYWARTLDGEPLCVETAGFSPLFNGKDLKGWEGDASLWSAKNGMIVGDSKGIKENQFLATEATYGDFILKFSVRLVDDAGNSGVQFRSVRVPGTEMAGYQADVGPGYWGSLYDESRRNKQLAPANPRALAGLHKGDWNQVVVRALGGHITAYLNDQTSVDYREADDSIARSGKIALQVHAGGPMRVEFKDLYIQPLPIATPDGSADDANRPGFHLRTVRGGDDHRKYVLYVPKDYDGTKRLPAVLFLHGSGERGDDGLQSAQIGFGGAINAQAGTFNAFAIMPQATKTWAADSDDAKAALRALDEVMEAYKVDPDRVVLTGLSMGGSGTWSIAAAEPKRWAAIAPVCGRGKAESAEALKGLPVWTFVGDLDSDAVVQNLRLMGHALRSAGATVKQTEYRNVGHNSWDRAYNNPSFVTWMLGQARQAR